MYRPVMWMPKWRSGGVYCGHQSLKSRSEFSFRIQVYNLESSWNSELKFWYNKRTGMTSLFLFKFYFYLFLHYIYMEGLSLMTWSQQTSALNTIKLTSCKLWWDFIFRRSITKSYFSFAKILCILQKFNISVRFIPWNCVKESKNKILTD